MDLALSPNAAKAIDDVLGPGGGERWLSRVPARLAALARDWGVHPTENLHAGTSGLVFRARCDESSVGDLALKLSFDEPELEAEHHALRVAQELDIRPLARAYRFQRGTMATFWISGRTADPAISPAGLVATLARIHVEVPAVAGLRLLGPQVRRSLDAARDRLPRAAESGLDDALLERAGRLADELADAGHRCYLHGDVHPTNVVTTPTGLVLLDPKGLVGDPAYDAAVWSLKADKLRSRRAWIDALGADYGRDRVAGWAAIVGACHAVSYAAHGKRLDRVRAYAEIAREGLAAVGA